MVSVEAQKLDAQLRAWISTMGEQDTSLEALRAGGEAMGTFGSERDDVTVEQIDMGGRRALVHIPAHARQGAILHLHGGGLTLGSPESHTRLAAHLAARSRLTVYNLDFRLAPENPFPAGIEDATAAFHWLVEEGVPADRIIMSGDSGGSTLALTTLMDLLREGIRAAGGILLSPWADFRLTSETFESNAESDVMCSRPMMIPLRDNYLPDGTGYDDPRVSPAASGNFAGLPPLIVQASSAEVLVGDARLVKQRATEAGVDVTYGEFELVPHVFQLFAGNLPEADEALQSIADWTSSLLQD
jgi:monoterpene epsilon-lactone hydrolase